jgi:DNA-binding transcriptional LysR family regulator
VGGQLPNFQAMLDSFFPPFLTASNDILKSGREFSVNTSASMIVNDHLSMVAIAKVGVAIAYTGENIVKAELKDGSLEAVFKEYCPTNTGIFLYFPAKSQHQPKLRAFIDFAKRTLNPSRAAR